MTEVVDAGVTRTQSSFSPTTYSTLKGLFSLLPSFIATEATKQQLHEREKERERESERANVSLNTYLRGFRAREDNLPILVFLKNFSPSSFILILSF